MNILKKKPNTSKKCEFSDVSDKLNIQYDLWVVNSCQLWLMWQWISNFRPYDKVTRGEFGTILSRLLWWDKYNGWNPYYKKHVNQLNIRWIMNNTKNAEKINESRGNVMVMLKRSETLWNLKIPSFEELDDDAFQCYVCYPGGCGYEDEVSWKIVCSPDECDYESIDKKWFIISYGDWYLWYSWTDDGLGDARLNITYRKLDNPCEIVKQTNVFHYNYDNVWKVGCIIDYWSDKKVENFNSKEKDPRKCMDDAEKYFYNLIVWWEKDEIFTLWMTSFKKNIANKSFSRDWRSKIYECEKNHRWENYKGVDITSFMTETTFDAEWYEEAIKEYDIKDAEIWYSCIKEILKG
jgi:hypothetical protein